MNRPFWKDEFDPAAEYVVCRKFLCGGVIQQPGQPFNKDLVTLMTLRGLFAKRDVIIATDPLAPKLGDPPRPPDGPPPEVKPTMRVDHRGFGKWFVIAADETLLAGPFDKPGAIAEMMRLADVAPGA